MTDNEALFSYRMKQAEETLAEAEKMLNESFAPRSIVNRAYYAMFYALLALLIEAEIPVKTSKHVGVISLFDKEFVKTGKFKKKFSAMLHNTFDDRLEGDYREFANISNDDAADAVSGARSFVEEIKQHLSGLKEAYHD